MSEMNETSDKTVAKANRELAADLGISSRQVSKSRRRGYYHDADFMEETVASHPSRSSGNNHSCSQVVIKGDSKAIRKRYTAPAPCRPDYSNTHAIIPDQFEEKKTTIKLVNVRLSPKKEDARIELQVRGYLMTDKVGKTTQDRFVAIPARCIKKLKSVSGNHVQIIGQNIYDLDDLGLWFLKGHRNPVLEQHTRGVKARGVLENHANAEALEREERRVKKGSA